MSRLYSTLVDGAAPFWEQYTQHDFVRQIGDGSLPAEQFEHYLKQDYVFLIHFARAFGLAAFKSRTLGEIKQAADMLSGIINVELDLHISYCKQWGIDVASLESTVESTANMAYTRFVLERGLAGDLVDLNVALAPCIIGYAVSARWLQDQDFLVKESNPYAEWIEMYASDDYQSLAMAHQGAINDIPWPDEQRLNDIQKTFTSAVRLEIDFWQMGLDLR